MLVARSIFYPPIVTNNALRVCVSVKKLSENRHSRTTSVINPKRMGCYYDHFDKKHVC